MPCPPSATSNEPLANLYEYRWLIAALTIVFIGAFLAYGYKRGWHQVILRHRVAFGIASVPILALTLWLGWSLGSPLFINVTVEEEEFPFAVNAVLPEGMELADVEGVMAGMAMVDDQVMREAMPEASGHRRRVDDGRRRTRWRQ